MRGLKKKKKKKMHAESGNHVYSILTEESNANQKKEKENKNIFSGRMWSIYKSDRITKPPEWLENLGRFVSTKIFSSEKDLQMDTEEIGIL